ncbi:50S ribosomal protein L21 [bacterium]|nr:50S ribosomal protein L21 [Chloroflexi bacterium CFX6]RIL12667.1 MAG: 50S ribosomal protein L21 [bacterium]
MYAIVQSGGHQYRVTEGQTIRVQRLEAAAGDKVTLDQVLMVGGAATRVGTPLLEGASVHATVVGDVKGDKLTVFKYKRKNRYRIKTGHRQQYTELKIDAIKG